MIHIKLSMSFPKSGARGHARSPVGLFFILWVNVERPRTFQMHRDLWPYPLKVHNSLKKKKKTKTNRWDEQALSRQNEAEHRNKPPGTICHLGEMTQSLDQACFVGAALKQIVWCVLMCLDVSQWQASWGGLERLPERNLSERRRRVLDISQHTGTVNKTHP